MTMGMPMIMAAFVIVVMCGLCRHGSGSKAGAGLAHASFFQIFRSGTASMTPSSAA
jgi:hypothetical protein